MPTRKKKREIKEVSATEAGERWRETGGNWWQEMNPGEGCWDNNV